MAQAMASMAGLRGTSQTVLEGSLQLSGSSRMALPGNRRTSVARAGLTVRAQQGPAEGQGQGVGVTQSGRRSVLGLVAVGLAGGAVVKAVLAEPRPIKPGGAVVKAVLAEPRPIKVGPAPPPSGGLPGTLNSDEPRDLDLPLKNRFYIQPLPPAEAAARAKESAKDIVNLKELIDKKQWPYIQMDLRLKASYLRYDLNTIISAKPREEKKPLKELTEKLFATIAELDHAAKIKSKPEAEKYYAATKSALSDVLAKLG